MIATMRLMAVIALALVMAACGRSGDGVPFHDVAQAAARQSDRVQVQELAEWLIEGRQDFALIDVRSGSDFDKGHIGDARNLPLAELVTEASKARCSETCRLSPSSSSAEISGFRMRACQAL